ncbi:MAG: hypothetical protein ICV83_22035 [Cytophagales bacterium]|nr:hypothetical protein [Cytophagales bacterium]
MKFVTVSKYLLYEQNEANPVAQIKTEGWSFFKPYLPYIEFRDGKKYFFHRVRKKYSGSPSKVEKEGYCEVCLKDKENTVACAYKFKECEQPSTGILDPDPWVYRDLEGTIEFEGDNYTLALTGLFFIEYMLYLEPS